MLYIINSMILPLRGGEKYTVKAREISIEEAKELLKSNEFVSAVGHESTASLLSNVLGVNVPYQRIAITVTHGDKILAFQLKRRLEEGKVIKTIDELNQVGYSMWLFEVE